MTVSPAVPVTVPSVSRNVAALSPSLSGCAAGKYTWGLASAQRRFRALLVGTRLKAFFVRYPRPLACRVASGVNPARVAPSMVTCPS